MRSSIYINEVTPEAVTMDFSASPSLLVSPYNCYGFAFTKTVEHLGLVAQFDLEPELYSRLRIEGSVDTIKGHTHQLQRHIGLIARYSVEKSGSRQIDREWIGRILGNLVQHRLPALPGNASLMRTMGLIVAPFANETNDDGVLIYYGRYPGTDTDRSVVKDETGKALGAFSARDIGGLLIGPNGLPAREGFDFKLRLPESDLSRLILIGKARGTSAGKELEKSLRQFLDKPEKPIISKMLEEEEMRNVLAGFRRVDLERISTIELGSDATLGDVIRLAVKTYLAECASNTELQEKIEGERQQLEDLHGSLGEE